LTNSASPYQGHGPPVRPACDHVEAVTLARPGLDEYVDLVLPFVSPEKRRLRARPQ
jgi:hypothetical protein